MRKSALYLSLLFLLTYLGCFGQIRTAHTTKDNSLIKFTENKNQWDNFIKYRAQLDGGALYVQNNALTYGFYDKETYRGMHANPRIKPTDKIKTDGFDVQFENSNPYVNIQSSKATADYCNYFIGNNPAKWASNVKNYGRLLYNNLWQNIDLEVLGQDNSVKYNFYVRPGAKAEDIKLHYDKIEKISLHKKELIIKTAINEMVEHEPYAYQIIDGKTVDVPCKFELKRNTVFFSFPKGYDTNYELVIDPVLVFACSSGSTADNFGMTATFDNNGNLYSGGTCFDNGFPILNPYDGTYNGIVAYGRTDVVITKYDSSGTFLHYSTYIGGAQGSEIVTSLIVDAQDNLYLYGATGSTDYPTSASAYDKTFNGGDTMTFMFNGTYFYKGTDIYISKLSAAGNQLQASTFIGGSGNDGVNTNVITTYTLNYLGNGSIYTLTESKADSLQYNYGDQYRGEIQLDNVGNPVINSSSRSFDFPTKNAIDNTLGGQQDAVVFKFNPNLSQLQWSTFIGGKNNDAGYALFIGKNNEVFTTGGTRSNDFPTTPGVLSPTYNGGKCDGYITKISPTGNSLLAATYIGTNDYDQSYFIQLDKNQNVYVFGQSLGNMPIINAAYNNPNSKQFITKLNNNLTSIIYSTVIGNGNGIINLSPAAFSVDYCENVYLSGWGGNIIYGPRTDNMPVTDTLTLDIDGYNFYVMNLSKNCNSLIFASYFGGPVSHEHVDGGTSRFDKKGIIYQSVCAGCGGNSDFPVSNPAWWPRPQYGTQWNQSSNCNNGTFKIDFKLPLVVSNYLANTNGCAPLTVNFTNLCSNDTAFLWNFGGGDTSTLKNPVRTFTNPGTYTVNLVAYNSGTCNYSDTSVIYVNVYPIPNANFSYTTNKCGNVFNFQDSSSNIANHWEWSFGDGNSDTLKNPTHTYQNPGTYTISHVVSTQYGCKDSLQKVVTILGFNPISVSTGTTVCKGTSVQLNATGGIAYQWSPASSLNNANIPNPIATPTATTHYTVNITMVNGVDTCVSSLHSNVTVSAYSSSVLMAFAHPDTIYSGQTTQLGTYTNGGNIVWYPNYNISNVNSPNPTAWPTHTTTYSAMYTDAYGCSFPISSVTVYVLTKDCNESTVFVPNTFTPNADGMNDVLYARSSMVTEIHFVIADRWGQIVFETTDITKGWDGVFNGKPCNPDVFGYYITYKCNNGKESFKKGNVTLIR